MSETRVWALMRTRMTSGCQMCGYALPRVPGEGYETTDTYELTTRRRDEGLHDLNVCETCLLGVMRPHVADPFGLMPGPQEPPDARP